MCAAVLGAFDVSQRAPWSGGHIAVGDIAGLSAATLLFATGENTLTMGIERKALVEFHVLSCSCSYQLRAPAIERFGHPVKVSSKET
jgi:hypothetical protein